ncbi:MAG TPA: hypothetical protein VGA16_05300 [Candidatus Limnocylindria bacterium]
MHRAIRAAARELPPSAAGGIVLVALFAIITALSAVAPRAPRETAQVAAAPSATPIPTATLPTTTPGPAFVVPQPGDPAVVRGPLVLPRPTPAPAPTGLGIAPEAGGIVFRACCEKGQLNGIWRYDGETGTVRRVGASGKPTADGRGYVVRQDDARYMRVDAASGSIVPIAPLGAISADAFPAGSDPIGAYVDGATWLMGRDGKPRRLPTELQVSTVHVSPDGRRVALLAVPPDPPPPERRIPTELWIVDLPDGTPRLLARVQLGGMGPTLQLGPWSPDGTLLMYWEISLSNSMNADGAPLRAVDVRTGTRYDLGVTLYGASRLSWKAPHTLAYVSGGSRMTWEHKTVRIWSPEAGATDVTMSGVGLNPSWSADGTKLYLVLADAHDYDPMPYFAGRDSGDRRLSVYDVATRRLTRGDRVEGRVYEGVRATQSGTSLLTMWRTTQVATSLNTLPPIAMTLGLLDPATGRTKPLVRTAGDVGFGYYGSYEGPEGMAWSAGR